MNPQTTDREINLGAVVQVIWDRSRKIFGLAFAAAALAFAASQLLPDRYGAWAQLHVKPSYIGTRSMAREKLVSVETYEHFITGEPQLLKVLEKFPQLKDAPYNMEKAKDLATRVSVDRVGETPIIQIYVELREDPQLAADVCNALAEQAVKLNDDLELEEAQRSTNKFINILSDRHETTRDLRQKYLELQKTHKMEILVKEIGQKLSTMELRRAEKSNLEISQLELGARIQSLQAALSEMIPTVPLQNSLIENPVLMESLREKNPNASAAGILKATVTSEAVNDAYLQLTAQLKGLKAQLDGDRAKYDKIVEELPLLEQEIKELEQKRIEWEMEEDVARSEWILSLEIQSGIDKEEGWAEATVSSNRVVLQVLNAAVADDEAESPKRLVIAGVAGTMTFLLALAYFILRDLHNLIVDRPAPVA